MGRRARMSQSNNDERPVVLPDVAEQMGAPAAVPESGQSAQVELPPFREFNAVASFDSSEEAREALLALERAGLDGSQLSFLGLDSSEQSLDERSSELDHEQISFVARGTAKG